jgi:SAM-dependent methyltransferase
MSDQTMNTTHGLQRARHLLGGYGRKLLRRLGFLKRDWNAALPEEIQFWEWALKDDGRNWHPDEWRNCTNPNLDLQEELRQLIPAPPGARVRILDVGSGPLTRVGKQWPGRDLEIVPTDPLADKYNELFVKISLRPLVPPVVAHGEKLLDRFQPNYFDLAYASNSLDHSYDPVAAIGQMLAVTKPGHYVYLWHAVNEGVRERYSGLHQWNFDIRNGEFVVDDGRRTQSITATFKDQAEVSCEFAKYFHVPIVIAKLKKLAPPGSNTTGLS